MRDLNVRRHFRGMAIGPRGLDQRAPRAPIARFGNPALAPRPTTGVLRRNEADEGGQLPRVVKAREIAELGDDGDRDEELDAAQGLQRLHDRIEPPRGRALEEFRLEALEAIDLFIDGAHGFLKDDLLRRRRTHDLREVPAMGVVPGRAPDVVPAQAQQERFQPQLRVLARHPRGIARATQIAEGFILDRRHVDGGEIARAQEPRELDGVTPIRLHAVARLLRDQRRRDHLTRQALRR